MNYRGEDLDLRTPQGRASMAGEIADKPELPAIYNGPRARNATPGLGRSDPIWVDDAVMTACNHAFDLARAHRASHVRLEHLLHALATVDVAAEILETRGVRVAALRRETGALIAGEIPVQMANGKAAPRRSDELEDTLRAASARAGRRGVAAGVDDLVDAMLDSGADGAAVVVLRRTGLRQVEPPQAFARAPAYAEPEIQRERVRMPAGSSYVEEALRPLRSEVSPTDSLQNSRIESLEQMVRALHADLIGERKGFSAMLQDVQRQLAAERDDGPMQAYGSSLAQAMDRIKSLEHTLDGRIGALEQAVHAAKSDGARNWAGLGERLKAFETAIAAMPADTFDPAPMDARLAAIEQSLRDRLTEASLEIVQLADRMKAIEDGQAAQRTQTMQTSSAIAAEIKELAQRVASASNGGAERVQGLLSERMQGLAVMLDRQRNEVAAHVTTALAERIDGLAARLEGRQAEIGRSLGAIGERITALERAMAGYVQKFAESAAAYDQDIGEMQQAMLKLNTNQQTLAGSLDQWRLDGTGDLGVVSNRVQGLERSFQSQMQLIEGLSAKMDGLYKVTAERIEKRSRFWYWLFGTSSWIAASWPGTPPAAPVRPPAQPSPAQSQQHPSGRR